MNFLDKQDDIARQKTHLEQLQHRRQFLLKKKEQVHQENLQLQQAFTSNNHVDDPMSALQQTQEAYRLAGASVVSTPEQLPALTLKFDALYQNQYPTHDYYTLELNDKGGHYTLSDCNSSLPPFLPVKKLLPIDETLNNGNVGQFVEQVWYHVYSYVQRREGVKHVMEEYKDDMTYEPDVNLPVTFSKFSLILSDTKAIQVTLQYQLTSILPDTATLEYVHNECEEDIPNGITQKKLKSLLAQGEELFKSNTLHIAVTLFIDILKPLRNSKD